MACSVAFKPNRRAIVFMDNATCASTQTYKFANLFNQFIRRFNPSFRNYYHTPVNCTFAGVIFTPGFKRMWFLYSHFAFPVLRALRSPSGIILLS